MTSAGALRPLGDAISGVEARKYPACVALEYLMTVGCAQIERIQIAFGIVKILPRLRIDAAHRPDHFRAEENVVDRNDFEEQFNSRQVIHAGIEEHVLQHMLAQRRPLHVLRQAPIPSPVIRYRSAAMRDDETQGGEVLEQIGSEKLHERRGISIDVVGAGSMEIRIA